MLNNLMDIETSRAIHFYENLLLKMTFVNLYFLLPTEEEKLLFWIRQMKKCEQIGKKKKKMRLRESLTFLKNKNETKK